MRRNGLGAALAFCAMVGFGCQGQRLNREQREWLRTAQAAYEEKQYARTIDYAQRILEQDLDSPETVRALYYKGLAEAYSGLRAQAYQDLHHAVTRDEYPTLRWRAYAALGSLHFEDQQWEQAAAAFEQAAALMPNESPRDTALYKQAAALQRLGRWYDARGPLEQLIADFPDSAYAEAARRQIDRAAEYYAVQVAEFAIAENAENFAFDLERRGLRAYVRPEPRGPKDEFVVMVGRYNTYEEAAAAAAELRPRLPDARVWP